MGGGRGFGTVRVGREPPPPHRDRNPIPFIDLGAMSEETQARDIRLELPGGVVLTIGRR